MSGLIEGAKRKIWTIANQLVSAQQETDVRFALIGYRDRGDSYVTSVYDLTSDIDAVYARLMQFQADGGGDGPESLNQALHEAVTRLDWSTSKDVYRVVFLVGDAPPHLDYQDDIRYDRSVRLARQRDITINEVQCGAWDETAQIWREIASLGMGTYAAIAQDGGMKRPRRTRYRLVVAPMLFMLKPGVAERLESFVRNGGTLVMTYLSGVVNETELVLRGGWPGGGLRKLAGIWSEEIDALYPNPPQRIVASPGNAMGLTGEFPVQDYCERVHPEGAAVLATYKNDFYAGMPALTFNSYGAGQVYYLTARPTTDGFLDPFMRGLVSQLKIARCLDVDLPEGVTVQKRSGGGRTFYFLHNCRRGQPRWSIWAPPA